MPIFRKDIKILKFQEKENEEPQLTKENTLDPEKEVATKKRTRLGFKYKKEALPEVKEIKEEKIEEIIQDTQLPEEKIPVEQKEEENTYKKKTILQKDMKGKPIYLEDTGEKLGIVFDTVIDKENNIVGYKIKDEKSSAVLSFPADQFDLNKDGLIFVPGWYTNALKIVEKLEFKDKISPELTTLLSNDDISNEELYEIFVKYDDEMAQYIEDAVSLKDMIDNRLRVLEKQRFALKDNLLDLTEKRLIKDIDRRQFSEDVMEHRRKANVLDVNIEKCKNLLKRIDCTSFGVLGKNGITTDAYSKKEEKPNRKKVYERTKEDNMPTYHQLEKEDPYKDKYFNLREQFEQLEEDYQELKVAIDKLLSKEEI